MSLYHYLVGFPDTMKMPRTAMLLDYTGHAVDEAQADRYGAITLPKALDTRQGGALLVEAEIDDETGDIIKAVWRLRATDELDVVLVVLMRQRRVKTVWINRHDDKHTTLDESRYTRP